MFRNVDQQTKDKLLTIFVNDTALLVPEGHTVAAALLAKGYNITRRSAVSEEQRGPYCLMGVCFECLVEINGTPNQQSCMTQVTDGMSIRFEDMHSELQSSNELEQERAL